MDTVISVGALFDRSMQRAARIAEDTRTVMFPNTTFTTEENAFDHNQTLAGIVIGNNMFRL